MTVLAAAAQALDLGLYLAVAALGGASAESGVLAGVGLTDPLAVAVVKVNGLVAAMLAAAVIEARGYPRTARLGLAIVAGVGLVGAATGAAALAVVA